MNRVFCLINMEGSITSYISNFIISISDDRKTSWCHSTPKTHLVTEGRENYRIVHMGGKEIKVHQINETVNAITEVLL